MVEAIAKLALFELGFICGAGVILFLRKKTTPPSFKEERNDK